MKIPRRTLWGLIGTAAWLVLIASFVFGLKGWAEFLKMEPNQFGDFFAGVFAPLAFLWLVIGYRQQGEELQLQREVLSLQRKETARLVDQATAQADAIKANELHTRRDTFLRVADLLVTELAGIAGTISGSVTGPEALAKAWNQYGSGDRNFFFRSLLYLSSPVSTNPLKRLSDNPDFQRTIIRYIAGFESLINQAALCDPDKLLRSQFEHSPMGSLYAALCLVNGREVRFVVRVRPTGLDQLN